MVSYLLRNGHWCRFTQAEKCAILQKEFIRNLGFLYNFTIVLFKGTGIWCLWIGEKNFTVLFNVSV